MVRLAASVVLLLGLLLPVVHAATASTRKPAPAPPKVDAPLEAELKTLLCERGRLMIDNRMDQAAMDNDWQGFQPGAWTCVPGQGVRVTSVPGQHPPYRIRKCDMTDLVLQVSFRFEGVDELGFGFDDDHGQHLMGCHLSPDRIDISRCPIIGKDRKDDAIDHANAKLERGVWHTLVWEIHGTEMLACVDEQALVYGKVDGIDCYKTYTAFSTGAVPGKSISVGRFRVWQAPALRPEWEAKKRAQVLEYQKTRH